MVLRGGAIHKMKRGYFQDYIGVKCGTVGNSNVTIPVAAKLIRANWQKE